VGRDARQSADLRRSKQTGSQRIIGSVNNAAVETALGQANGVPWIDRVR
jgi:hypothetical protein